MQKGKKKEEKHGLLKSYPRLFEDLSKRKDQSFNVLLEWEAATTEKVVKICLYFIPVEWHESKWNYFKSWALCGELSLSLFL